MYLRRQLWRGVVVEGEKDKQKLPSGSWPTPPHSCGEQLQRCCCGGCASFSSSACLPPPPPNPVQTISVGPKPPASGQGCAFISRTWKGLTLWYFFSFCSFRISYIKSNLISGEWRRCGGSTFLHQQSGRNKHKKASFMHALVHTRIPTGVLNGRGEPTGEPVEAN